MKNIRLFILSLLLVSCTSNNVIVPEVKPSNASTPSPIISVSASPVDNHNNSNTFNYFKLTKELENKIGGKGINGISSDVAGNTYILSSYGKLIIKINKDGSLEYGENPDISMNSTPNMFFHIDSKGNGYLIPDTFTVSSIRTDPVTMKVTTDRNKFSIYKISNLKIVDRSIIDIEDSIFKSYCLSQDDCSDLYLNVGGKDYSLDEFLKSKKEYIENDDTRSNLFNGRNKFFNSSGSGFYLRGSEDNKASIYSFINGISKKTDISFTFSFPLYSLSSDIYDLNGNLDNLGNGYMIYIDNGKSTYHQITNYNIGQAKSLDIDTGRKISYSTYTAINDEGNGCIINSYSFSKINNFKIQDQKELLIENQEIYSNEKSTIIDKEGNGYIAFNKYVGRDPEDPSRSQFKSKIFAVRNYNLFKE